MGKIILITLYCILLTNLWWLTFTVESLEDTMFALIPISMSVALGFAFVFWCIENWETGE